MPKIPELEVITKKIDTKNLTSFKEMIEKRKVLKTKLKLAQIYYIDKDIKTLHENNLSLSDIDLEDFYITKSYHLYVPLENKIIIKREDDKIKLKSYLIYLSYLYNFNFLEVYLNTPNKLYSLIYSLNISEKIKQNLFMLLAKLEGEYFNKFIEELNSSEYRENLNQDKIRLARELKLV